MISALAQKHFRLITLGRIALASAAGEDAELGKRRRKLALLAVLALSSQPPTRDLLAQMFWGDEDEERARHSLSDALSHLRRVLGRDAIGARSEVVELHADGRLEVDAVDFAAACATRDWERATSLYSGPFLADLYVDRSPHFDAWVARERDRFTHLFVQAAEARCAFLAREGDWQSCRLLASRWITAAPGSPAAAQCLLRAGLALTDAVASRAVLHEYEANAKSLMRELGITLDPEAEALARELSARIDAASAAAAAVQPTQRPEVAAPLPPAAAVPPAATIAYAPMSERPPVTRLPVLRWAMAVVLAAFLGLAWWTKRDAASASVLVAPASVAITDIQVASADTSIAWLRDGLREMIAAELAHVDGVNIVAPSTLRDVLLRAGWRRPLDAARQQELARRVHANWSVSGIVNRSEAGYQLDITLRDVERDEAVRQYVASGVDAITVAGQAAAFVLAAIGSRSVGPHLSDVETSNADAFRHFSAGVQLESQGKYGTADQEYDAAITADSAFVSAIAARIRAAQQEHDTATYLRIKPLLDRASSRITEWDRMQAAAYTAMHDGEHARTEVLGRQLVQRYPFDPRAYQLMADIYQSHGKRASADSILTRLLALDSLAIAAGTGPCAPCEGYGRLILLRADEGHLSSAEQLARRWADLQPALVDPWLELSMVLSFEGRFDAAFAAIHRAQTLDTSSSLVTGEARIAVMARRLDHADSLMARFASDTGGAGADAIDIHALVQRERGQLRASVASYARMQRRFHRSLTIVAAHTLGRLGDVTVAQRMFDSLMRSGSGLAHLGAQRSDDARAFAWHHAVEADAIAERSDTTSLRALADSIQRIGASSYYARDWHLHHHVLGLIAMRAANPGLAAREFALARWGVAGWTRTNVEIARAELALHHPERAVVPLRDAYAGPLDAMGRYVPRSELDFWMAQTFQQAGSLDSARVYGAYVRNAWKDADPEVRRRLSLVP